jgi:hypothetical protein
MLSVRRDLVTGIDKKASLSVQIKDVRINLVRIMNQAEGRLVIGTCTDNETLMYQGLI